MPLISLAMIVKNEEANLAHCLESVKKLIDEIIIVDTGSTDNTIEIARSFGAKIHQYIWCDDFSTARNEALKHCTGNWILIMDADEAIDPLDYDVIKNACINPIATAYILTTRNYVLSSNLSSMDGAPTPNTSKYNEGNNLPFFMDTETIRLAKNIKGLAFEGKVHETLRSFLVSKGKTISKLPAVIHHYGKLFVDREKHKSTYYLMLASQEAEKNPKDKWAIYNLLQQALKAGEWEMALRAARDGLQLGSDLEPMILFGGGFALQQLGKHTEAIDFFDWLLDKIPNHSLALLHKGSSYMALGNFNTARQLMLQSIELEPKNIQAYGCLAELELQVNNISAARSIALEALAISPSEPELYNLLINIELTIANVSGAATSALRAIQNCPNAENSTWYGLATAYLLQSGEMDVGKSILEAGLKAFPDDPELKQLLKSSY
ncbi:MAG: glycosyltransferase [Holophagaceae bacterium]|nr:glycosyltransferase [Holophagaceae bacterium]